MAYSDMCALMQQLITFFTIKPDDDDVAYSLAASLLKIIFTFDEGSPVYKMVMEAKGQDEAPDQRQVFS